MADSNSTKFDIIINFRNFSVVIFSFVGITSNALMLVVFNKDPLKCFRNSGTYLLMNLSVSDLATCLFGPFYFQFIHIIELRTVCRLLIMSSGFASILSIVAISFDRLLLVVYPLRHRHFITGKKIVIWLFCIWVMASILPTLGLLYRKPLAMKAFHCCAAILVVLSVALYAITYSKLKEHSKNVALQLSSTESRAQNIRIQKDKQFLKTIILIACIEFFCVVPSMVYFLLYRLQSFSIDNLVHGIFFEVSRVAFCTNFAINPWIYIFRLRNYRKTFYLVYFKRGP